MHYYFTVDVSTEHEYTDHEQQLLWRCINLLQGRKGSVMSTIINSSTLTHMRSNRCDSSPSGDEGCVDMNASYVSNSSLDLCSPDKIELPCCWEAPAPPVLPILQPLRLYVPELEEIRISPVVARKGK